MNYIHTQGRMDHVTRVVIHHFSHYVFGNSAYLLEHIMVGQSNNSNSQEAEFHIGRISIQISKKGLYYVSSSTITIPLAAFDFWECFLLTVKSSNLWYNRYPMFLVLVLHPSDGKEQPYHCHPNHYRFQQWTDDATPTCFTLLTRCRKKVELQS
jgi:hypothetical protein